MSKFWVTVFAIAVVFAVGMSVPCPAYTPQDRAIRAAKDAAQNMGIAVGEAEVIYDPDNKKWEERVAIIEKTPSDPNHGKLPHGILYNKKYDTILLDFKEGAKDADTWAFIDEDTGDVLTIYQEKR